MHAFHGGRAFEVIGEAFEHLEREPSVITADVLDAWFDASPRVLAKLREHLPWLARTSPPAYSQGMVREISRARGLPETCILAGAGSSDLLFTVLPRLVPPGETALILDPMYGEYAHLLERVMGLRLTRHRLPAERCFRVDPDALMRQVRSVRPRLLALVNPNSPTGQHWERASLQQFLAEVPRETLVV